MAKIEIKSFDSPDETRPFEGNGRVEIVNLGGREIGKGTFEPHLGHVLSGRMRVYMDDGTVGEIGPGDVFAIPAGHDAEVIGDEPCVMIDIGEEDADYAKRA